MDDEERCSDEEAAEAYKQYMWEREYEDNGKRLADAWENLLAECGSKRKERRESL